jgi:lambda family phage portal protein
MQEVENNRLETIKKKVGWNALDRLIEKVAPVRAARRMQARMLFSLTGGGYNGADRDRRGLRGLTTTAGSADADINFDLDTLRARTAHLARNNPIGGGAIHTAVSHAIGTGLALNPHLDRDILGLSAEEAKALEKEIRLYWRVFLEECDFYRKLDIYGLQSLAFRSTLERADCLVILPWKKRPGDVFGTKVQLVEGDRIANPHGRADSMEWSAGVKLDTDGSPIGYNVKSYHPGDIKSNPNREEQFYAAFDGQGLRRVLHLFWALRIGQHRGVPYLAPVIEILAQLGRYTEAEVMAAVIAGMFTAFVKTQGRDGLSSTDLVATDGKTESSDGDVQMGYGAMVDLEQGEDVSFANPGRPNQAFDGFVLALCRQVGMALELPYEVLVKHFTASYSASRAALLELWMFVRARRAWMVKEFCQPVYEVFMWELVSSGYVNLPGFLQDPLVRRAYLGAEWVGDAMPTVDPVKDIVAAEKRMQNKLTTREEECMALTGTEWEPKVEQLKYEQQLLGAEPVEARNQDQDTSGEPNPDQPEDETVNRE